MNCPKCNKNTDTPKIDRQYAQHATGALYVYVVWTCKYCGKHLQEGHIDVRYLEEHIKHYSNP